MTLLKSLITAKNKYDQCLQQTVIELTIFRRPNLQSVATWTSSRYRRKASL